MVINCVMTSTWAHLLGAHAHGVDMRPPALNILSVGSSTPFEEVKGISKLARATMTVYVKLWNDVSSLIEDPVRDAHERGELKVPFHEIPRPLTSDIVRQDQLSDDDVD
jgi:hypothetical protein